MDKLTTKYWLPLLVIALFVAVSIELSSVEKIDLDRKRAKVHPTAPQEQVAQETSKKTPVVLLSVSVIIPSMS